MRRLRVLVLMHPDFVPPDSTDGYTARQINEWKTEFDVVSTLRASGHDVRVLGAQEEIKPVREEIESFKPHVVFTLLEQFHGEVIYDQNVALAETGMAVLLVSADHAELQGMSHRVLVFTDGEVVAEMAGKDATEEAVLHARIRTDNTKAAS